MLAFMQVSSADFARSYHDFIIVTDRARNGVLYATQNVGTPGAPAADSTWQNGISAAALADKTELGPGCQVNVSPSKLSVVPANNPYVSVTVTSPFQTIMTYPGIPSSFTISRTITMRLQPTVYRMN